MKAITRQYVRDLFTFLETGHSEKFFAQVADDVQWTVMGTHPVAGQYHSKEDLLNATFRRLDKILQGRVVLQTAHIYIDNDQRTAIVELLSLSKDSSNKPYNRAC